MGRGATGRVWFRQLTRAPRINSQRPHMPQVEPPDQATGGLFPGMPRRAATRRCTHDAANHPRAIVTTADMTIAKTPSIVVRSISWLETRNTAPPIVT